MATVPYILTQADLEFHSQIMLEHCVFLHLAIEVEPYKTQAHEQWQLWKQYIEDGYPEGELSPLVSQLRILKKSILDKSLDGEWLGWLSASFMRHVLEELEEFSLLTQGLRPIPEIMAIQAWRLMSDHLEDAESKTDPIETEVKQQEQLLIKEAPAAIQALAHREYEPSQLMVDYQQAVLQLAADNGQPANDVQFMIGLSMRAGEKISQMLGAIQTLKPKTVINELLLRHWIVEGHYHAQELAVALQELRL